MDIANCPLCYNKMELKYYAGSTKTFPSVALQCNTEDCYWGMHIIYDDFIENKEVIAEKMIKQWNEGLENAKA